MRKIKLKEVQDILEEESSNTVIINVLPSSSFEIEHIPHSVNIPLDSHNFDLQVEEQISDRNTPVIVYCSGSSCSASKDAAVKLEQSGFTNVMHFQGGMEEWKNAGKAIEAGI